MGVCASSDIEADPEKWEMLLLGHTGVGKSTILKNIKMLCQPDGYSDEEKENMTQETIMQLIGAFAKISQDVVNHMKSDDTGASDKYSALLAEVTRTDLLESNSEAMFSVDGAFTGKPIFQQVLDLWADEHMENAMKRVELSLNTAFPTYEEHLHHWMTAKNLQVFAKGEFSYDDTNILYYRTQTRGYTQYDFTGDQAGLDMDQQFQIIDVGGHMMERKFWEEHYTTAKSVWFIMALDDYHKSLAASKDTEMEEGKDEKGKKAKTNLDITYNIFDQLCAVKELQQADFVIVMNKVDAFKKKFKSKHRKLKLSKRYPDFKGQTVEEGIEFLFKKFSQIHEKSGRREDKIGNTLPKYVTCATDHESTGGIVRAIVRNMISKSMKKAGII